MELPEFTEGGVGKLGGVGAFQKNSPCDCERLCSVKNTYLTGETCVCENSQQQQAKCLKKTARKLLLAHFPPTRS